MILPEPFQASGHRQHFAELHDFTLHSLSGINHLAVHRFMHRGTQIGVPHTHSDERKRGWVPYAIKGTPT